ncbi:MAG: hypothetical protein V4539_06350 [Bacteroidota bacterium]
MSLKRILFLLFIIFSMGCTEFKKKLAQKITSASLTGSWFLYNISHSNKPRNAEDGWLQRTVTDSLVKQGLLLTFFKDGNFTEINGADNYQSGKWQIHGKDQLVFTRRTGDTGTAFIKLGTYNGRRVLTVQKSSSSTALNFVLYALPLKDDKEDPFYPANNLWRVKPLQQESPQQLQERLTNYFGHLTYLLQSAIERKQKIVPFQLSQGIVQVYRGGIGIHRRIQVPETWTSHFYNNDDAMRAYKMFGEYLKKGSYKGDSNGDWIEDDYKILSSIYNDAKQGKFLNLQN